MWQTLKNIFSLGIKELMGLSRDVVLMALIVFSFSLQLYTTFQSKADNVHNATIVIVDEDKSQLTIRLAGALLPPYFKRPIYIERYQLEPMLDNDIATFSIVFPINFEKDLKAGLRPTIQVNVDATRTSQAFAGNAYISKIFRQEISRFLNSNEEKEAPIKIVVRRRYNPNLKNNWFATLMELLNNATMLGIILTGAALIREREHGTLEHLLVMPVSSLQIIVSKIWSMTLVVTSVSTLSFYLLLHHTLGIPMNGSLATFIMCIAIHLVATTSLGIFLACIASNMAQLGLLLLLVFFPMQMLSGGYTPYECMPDIIQKIMMAAPTSHIITIAQKVVFRGAHIELLFHDILWLLIIGSVFFIASLAKFRKSI